MGILRKFQQYRRLPQDPPPGPPHHLEEELDRLTGKIVRISPLPLSWRSPGHLLLSGQPPVQDRGSGPGGGPGPRGGVRGVRHQQSQHADPALQPPGQQGGYSDIQGGYSNILIYILTLPCRWCVGNASSAPSRWP